jgi:cytochrome oxidase Cu insertion factor (SCO1/SenC/PrrC family)
MSGPSETEAGNAPATPLDAAPNPEPGPTVPPIDRAAALAEGAPGIPAKFAYWALGVALVVSLGGLIGERVFSSAGLNPVATTTPQRVATTLPVATPTVPTPNRSLNSSLASFMGLSTLTPHKATPFTLTDQGSRPTPVPGLPPRVVVVTFFNAPCNDICPVVAAEIVQADADLGPAASEVEFVTVNTDPAAVAQSAEAPVLNKTGLEALSNWHMVTGPLATLNAVWKAYGVSISVDKKTDLEAHNDVMTFIDGRGNLRYRATPFADESTTGTFSLPPVTIARWGQGIATYAGRLINQ